MVDADRRILLDISTSMLWFGPPHGIVRVERQLALWALANVPNIVFVFFDPLRLAYCTVRCDVTAFLTGEAVLYLKRLERALACGGPPPRGTLRISRPAVAGR